MLFSNTPKIQWASIDTAVLYCICIVSLGCSGSPGTDLDVQKQKPDPVFQLGISNYFAREAGKVVSGTLIKASFRIRNETKHVCQIPTSRPGIVVNCGCSSIKPAQSKLEVNEEMTVDVVINTSGKSGPISNGGTIHWETDEKELVSCTLAVHADVFLPLLCEPASLTFEKSEVAQGISKSIRLLPQVAVKWSSLRTSTTSSSFEIVDTKIVDGVANVTVRLIPDGQNETVAGELFAHIVIDSSDIDSVVPVHLYGSQAVVLSARPSIINLSNHIAKEGYNARLRLTGTDIEIDTIRCEGFSVEWDISDVRPKQSCSLSIRLRELPGKIIPAKSTIVITSKHGSSLQIPCFVFLNSKVPIP